MTDLLEPISPGEILLEEYLKPLGISQNRLSRDLNIPVSRVSQIVHAKRSITADMALRLATYFGTTPELWMNLQSDFDLRIARRTTWPSAEKQIHPLARAARS